MTRSDGVEKAEAVRAFIAAGGNHTDDLIAGCRFGGDDPGHVLGLQVKTRGRVGNLARWQKEFILWAPSPATTLGELYDLRDTWLSGAAS